jgi:hypothetical protein
MTMGLSALSVCACGHVANHHGDAIGCHIAGCPCRRFDAGSVSLERHNEMVAKANRTIRKLMKERDELAARLAEHPRPGDGE